MSIARDGAQVLAARDYMQVSDLLRWARADNQ